MLNYELNRNVCAQQRKKSAAPWVEPRSEVAKFKEHSGWFVPMPLLSAFPPTSLSELIVSEVSMKELIRYRKLHRLLGGGIWRWKVP